MVPGENGDSRAVEALREVREETSVRKVAFAGAIGATIEWYDFFLYGTAALVFDQLFFPAGNPTAGTLAAYATFAAGFVARPVGGLILGQFGDRVGRRPSARTSAGPGSGGLSRGTRGHEVGVRAVDGTGGVQPDVVGWNDLGYLYDGVVGHPVEVL